MLTTDIKNTEAISAIGDTLSVIRLVEGLPLVLSSEGPASKQGGTNCLDGDSVNTSGSSTTVSIKGAYGRIPTTRPARMKYVVTQPLCGSQGVGGQPVVIDAERGI
jgi:hypothetical protein